MNKKLSLFLGILLLFAACSSEEDKDHQDMQFKNVNQTINKPFSDLKNPDQFKIELLGRKPADMILIFSIKNAGGKEIYHTHLKGKDLLGATDPNVDLTNEKAQMIFLKTIAADFFSEENFLEPAVMPEDQPDKHVPDTALYAALKRSGLNGFKYRLGKENNVYIAWSEKDQKVKTYYQCCP